MTIYPGRGPFNGHRQADQDHRSDRTGADPFNGAVDLAATRAGAGAFTVTDSGLYVPPEPEPVSLAELYSPYAIRMTGLSPFGFGGVWGQPRTREPVGPLPTERTDTAIRALKVACLTTDHERRTVRLGAIAAGTDHAADGVACCNRDPEHAAPDVDCTCGFYALKDDSQINPAAGEVVIDVELSGRVIEHEHGYRAERQRILCVNVPSRCAGWLCDEPASVLSFKRSGATPYCSDHATGKREARLGEVSNILGTEVRWTDIG